MPMQSKHREKCQVIISCCSVTSWCLCCGWQGALQKERGGLHWGHMKSDKVDDMWEPESILFRFGLYLGACLHALWFDFSRGRPWQDVACLGQGRAPRDTFTNCSEPITRWRALVVVSTWHSGYVHAKATQILVSAPCETTQYERTANSALVR